MKIAKQKIKARISIPGAIAQQELNFGNATGYGLIAGEYFPSSRERISRRCSKGWIRSLPVTHWGYMIEGEVTVSLGIAQKRPFSGDNCSTGHRATESAWALTRRSLFFSLKPSIARW